jgi:hypothetical protein
MIVYVENLLKSIKKSYKNWVKKPAEHKANPQ